MQSKVFYLPIETKAREMLGKLLLAAKAVERGWVVIMGYQHEIKDKMLEYPPGLFMEISIPEIKAEMLADYKNHGHRIVSMCEESIVYTNPQDYCGRKIGPNSLEATDLVIAPGKFNEDHLLEFSPKTRGKIVVAGNPRFDTLLPNLRVVYQAEADRIRRQFGKFLLVNTNFGGTANPYKRNKNPVENLIKKGIIKDKASIAFKRRAVSYKTRHFEQLKETLIDISRAGVFDHVIVRPHPTENHDVWREWGAKHNIQMRFEGSANGWILAANAILHTGCTTAIESLLLDRPVASFIPEPDSEFFNQGDEISIHVSNAREFLEQVARWDNMSQDDLREYLKVQRHTLMQYVENAESSLAADRMLDAFDKLAASSSDNGSQSAVPDSFKSLKFGYGYSVKRFMDKVVGNKPKTNYASQKFPSLELKDMKEPVSQWLGTGVLKQIPKFTRVGEKVWMLY